MQKVYYDSLYPSCNSSNNYMSMKNILRFSALLIMILGFLKVAHIIDISWIEVIFPVWIFLCLLVTLSVLVFIIIDTFILK